MKKIKLKLNIIVELNIIKMIKNIGIVIQIKLKNTNPKARDNVA